jgi:subtilisin family serine protease
VKKYLAVMLCALIAPSAAMAAMNGQILNCNSPNPAFPDGCVDNWALDMLDASKTEIQNAKANGWNLPRDRKHYFDGDGTGVHIFILDTGVYSENPEFKKLDSPAVSRVGTRYNDLTNTDHDAGSHGTRVAGIAAGVRFGLAKDAAIHPIRNAKLGLDQIAGSALFARLDWIEREFLNGARPAVLNMSFNSPTTGIDPDTGQPEDTSYKQTLTDKVNRLIALGVVVVASAGNKNQSPTNFWPSEIPDVIVVGGVDEMGNRWIRESEMNLCTDSGDCGSNFGSAVDLWAPAKLIRSAIDTDNDAQLGPLIRSGTSFAAPLVTGLAALYLEANPGATPAQVLSALRSNAASLGDIDGNGTTDYLVRSFVGLPACNVPQRLFTDTGEYAKFSTIDLADSCPSGYTVSSLTMPSHGQNSVTGIAPDGIAYLYTPSTGYAGPDAFNYTIKQNTGSTYGTGTVKVIVQPNVN